MGNPPTQTDTFYRKIFGRFYGTTSSAKISSIPHPHRKGLDAYLPDGLSFLPLSYLYDDEVARFAWEGAVMKDLGSWARCYRNLVNYLFICWGCWAFLCMSWAIFFMIFRSSLSLGLSSWSSSKWQLSWLGLCQFSNIAKYQTMLVVYLHIHMIFICSFWQNIRVLTLFLPLSPGTHRTTWVVQLRFINGYKYGCKHCKAS